MARRRFFVEQIRQQQAQIEGEQAHHLTRVLRVEKGQRYEISDGQAAYLAEVVEARKSRVVFAVIEPLPPTPLPVRLILLPSLVKFDHFEWMLEKATELGVERFVPVIAGRCEKGLRQAAEKRAARWRRILVESGQQCRRDHLPAIASPVLFPDALITAGSSRFILEESRCAPSLVSAAPGERRPEDQVLVLIGPEGGWTDHERQQAEAAGWRGVSVGPHILRAETAALAGAAVVINLWANPAPVPSD
jgi:16S rRNA (uracil1498-N3)-methyltransferase